MPVLESKDSLVMFLRPNSYKLTQKRRPKIAQTQRSRLLSLFSAEQQPITSKQSQLSSNYISNSFHLTISRVLRRNETNVISAILRYAYIQNLHENLLLLSLPWSQLVIWFRFNPGLTKIIFTLLRNDTSLCYWNRSVNKWN